MAARKTKQIKSIKDLTPDPANVNKGTERGHFQLDWSLTELGAGRSILTDADGVVIAGNKTLEAAADRQLPVRVIETDGKELVVVQRTDLRLQGNGKEATKARQLAIADNRVSELNYVADIEQLLAHQAAGIDLSPLYLQDELDAMLASLTPELPEAGGGGDEFDPAAEVETRCKAGDLWLIHGNGLTHRLLCGDSTKAEDVARAMNGEKANAVVTDPPYGLGDTQSDKNNYESYQDTKENLQELISGFLPLARKSASAVVITPGNMNQRLYPAPDWTMAWFTPAGTGRGPWGFCCWQPILSYGKDPKLAKGKGSHPDAIVHTESAEKNGHPCPKPVGFWEWLLKRVSEDGETILDFFGGSGTTLIACHRTGRQARLIEIEPKYCDVILSRAEAEGLTVERAQ
jgi:hypothetical protein